LAQQKRRTHLFSSYRLNLQALMTLTAFNSSSLRLRFIFLSLASLITSHLSSFLPLPFWSMLFCFCPGLGFFQPYHHMPRAKVLRLFMVLAARYMPLDTFFSISPPSICIFSLAVLSRADVKREVMMGSKFLNGGSYSSRRSISSSSSLICLLSCRNKSSRTPFLNDVV
jgi:hypothetical protein